jgi:hypothetical protein
MLYTVNLAFSYEAQSSSHDKCAKIFLPRTNCRDRMSLGWGTDFKGRKMREAKLQPERRQKFPCAIARLGEHR